MLYGVPIVLSTVNVKTGGESADHPPTGRCARRNPAARPVDDQRLGRCGVRRGGQATGRKKLLMTALWTEACLTFPTLDALREGHEVYPIVDAVGGTSLEAHRAALERIVQAGAQPTSWFSRSVNCNATGRVQRPLGSSLRFSSPSRGVRHHPAHNPLAGSTQERGCLGSGNCATSVVPPPDGLSSVIVPPNASILSLSPTRPEPQAGSAPPTPSSRTQTQRLRSRSSRLTSIPDASVCSWCWSVSLRRHSRRRPRAVRRPSLEDSHRVPRGPANVVRASSARERGLRGTEQ